MRFLLILSLLALPLLTSIGGCTHTPTKNSQDHWGFSGKIGITTPEESVAGFIQWQQQADDFDIYVSGPLGQGSTRIQGNSNQATLTQGGKVHAGVNPQEMIYQQLGWFFPLKNLPFWLQGKKAPFSPAKTELKDGKLAKIEQDLWSVELQRYNAYYDLPERIKIRQGKWKFLIVVKNWSVD